MWQLIRYVYSTALLVFPPGNGGFFPTISDTKQCTGFRATWGALGALQSEVRRSTRVRDSGARGALVYA
jgi:hypothetical protein